MKSTFFFILVSSIFITNIADAQKIFSEGLIKYDVFRNGGEKAEGIYIISVKSGMIKQEWAMNNGFNNVTIYNQKTGTTLSLNMKDETRYALEISAEEMKEKNKRFDNAVLSPTSNSKKIAGYNTISNNVAYNNGDGVEIFYTPDLIPQNQNFNTMFPGLKGIALEYITKASKDVSFKFVATNVEIKIIDNKIFEIPADYKIVNKAELEKLK